jgi:RimJ/RimL family protein N-acetyltransferase
VQTLSGWGFDTLNLNRVFLRVFADNARAIRCYAKVGYQQEGRLRQHDFYNGAYRDVLIMGLLRGERARPNAG